MEDAGRHDVQLAVDADRIVGLVVPQQRHADPVQDAGRLRPRVNLHVRLPSEGCDGDGHRLRGDSRLHHVPQVRPA